MGTDTFAITLTVAGCLKFGASNDGEGSENGTRVEEAAPVARKSDVKAENEAKKEYLLRYRDAVRSEKQIDEEIKQLRLDTMMPAVVNDGMPHGSGGGDLSGYAARVDALQADLKEQKEKRFAIQREILRAIEKMPNEVEKVVLKYRYIHLEDGYRLMSWEKIAVKIGYEYRNTLYLHGKALSHFNLPENFA